MRGDAAWWTRAFFFSFSRKAFQKAWRGGVGAWWRRGLIWLPIIRDFLPETRQVGHGGAKVREGGAGEGEREGVGAGERGRGRGKGRGGGG